MNRISGGKIISFLLFNCINSIFLFAGDSTDIFSAAKSLEKKLVSLDQQKFSQSTFIMELETELAKTSKNDDRVTLILVNKLLLSRGENYLSEKIYDRAVLVFNTYLKRPAIDLKDSINAYTGLREAYITLNNLPKALEAQFALDEFRKRTKVLLHKQFMPRLSGLYYEFNMYHEAIEEANKEIKEYPEFANDNSYIAHYFNELGLYYTRLGDIKSALANFNKGLDCLQKLPEKDKVEIAFFIGLIKGNIAQAIMEESRFEEAIPLLKEDIRNSLLFGNIGNAGISGNELARCYYELGEIELAKQEGESAFAILNKLVAPKSLIMNRKLLLDIYKKDNNSPKIIETYEFLSKLQDSILNSEHNKHFINQQIMHEMERHEKENNRKQKIIAESRLQNESYALKQKIIVLLLIIVLLVLSLLIIYTRKIRKKRKMLSVQYNKISEQKEIIESSLKEKGFLLAEIHHRVKNNLQIISSLLNLQSHQITNKDALLSLMESKRRIEAMALIHQLLYVRGTINEVETDVYFENLILKIADSFSFPDKNIKVNFAGEKILLHMDKAIPLGLIFNEIVTNSFKYAFKSSMEGNVKVEIKKLDEKICFMASDDGIGFPEDIKDKKSKSLGLELIEALCGQLDADLRIESNMGVKYTILL
jgi:two-component sensor histidine kinase